MNRATPRAAGRPPAGAWTRSRSAEPRAAPLPANSRSARLSRCPHCSRSRRTSTMRGKARVQLHPLFRDAGLRRGRFELLAFKQPVRGDGFDAPRRTPPASDTIVRSRARIATFASPDRSTREVAVGGWCTELEAPRARCNAQPDADRWRYVRPGDARVQRLDHCRRLPSRSVLSHSMIQPPLTSKVAPVA